MEPTKVMFLNPVGTADYDAFFAQMAQEHKEPTTEVHVTSLDPRVGAFTHIEYRSYEALVTPHILWATHQAAQEGFHALVIGCFYDTALLDAREVSSSMVVIAPCHASIETALHLANSFSIIVGRRKWVHQMESTVQSYGYGRPLRSFRSVDMGVVEFQQDHDCTRERLVQAGRAALQEDYAESIILGCTLETGFYQELQEELGVPVIDPSIAALKVAEHAAQMRRRQGWIPSRAWSCEAPPVQEMAALGIFQEPYRFGNRIVVPAA